MRITEYWADQIEVYLNMLSREDALKGRDDIFHEVWVMSESAEPVMMMMLLDVTSGRWSAALVASFDAVDDVSGFREEVDKLLASIGRSKT